MSFFQTYDELLGEMNKSFRTKKNLSETAQKFSDLAAAQDSDNPFVHGQIGLAKYGEMQCYAKMEDKQKLIKTAITAARMFMKSATFNLEISRAVRESWSDPLSDGIQCYRSAIDALIAENRSNLAVSTLIELAKAEASFDFLHYAANAYEEAVELCVKYELRPRLLIDTLNGAIECYVKCDRFDLALILVENTTTDLNPKIQEAIHASEMLKSDLTELHVTSVLLDIANMRFGSVAGHADLQGDIRHFLKAFSDAAQRGDPTAMSKATSVYREANKLTDLQDLVIAKGIVHIEKSVELGK